MVQKATANVVFVLLDQVEEYEHVQSKSFVEVPGIIVQLLYRISADEALVIILDSFPNLVDAFRTHI